MTYPCLCDEFVFPDPLNIGAGLDALPRQIATFPEFRRAMLHELKSEAVSIIDKNNQHVSVLPFTAWRARDKNDLGILLLEMWAYICDSLSFYDEALANESYLSTIRLRQDIRRLVGILGYLPRPAVGSTVALAAKANGRLGINLPAGTAFRSGAFDGNPPQVFELTRDAIIHPLTNSWKVSPPHSGKIMTANPAELVVSLQQPVRAGDLLLLTDNSDASQDQAIVISQVVKYTGADGLLYTKLVFAAATNLKAGTILKNLQLFKPQQSAALWTTNPVSGQDSLTDTTLTLNVPDNRIKPGDSILVAYQSDIRSFSISGVALVGRALFPDSPVTVVAVAYTMPGAQVQVTQLALNKSINAGAASSWTNALISGITVYSGMQPAATVLDEPNPAVTPADTLGLDNPVEIPFGGNAPAEFLLQDKNIQGAKVEGRLDFQAKQVIPDMGTPGNPSLTMPVTVFGNVLEASRGESVKNEKLGSGNASMASQAFKLKKKPLAYYLSPTASNDNGVANTLTVYVNGTLWSEMSNFYGVTENEQVYIVRQNDDGDSLVIFGDGIRGQRLPSGVDNIIVNYRFGAELACPPAGSVNQISKPVKGLQSVVNILAASGGEDAQTTDDLRRLAPPSVLLLGRVVSLADMEALAASFPGVRAVKAEWRWDKTKQRTAAHIFYIGDDGLAIPLSQRLRSYSDPTVAIRVEKAQARIVVLSLNIRIDPRSLAADVIADVREALTDPLKGLLAPENIGIGDPLYRSRIFGEVLKIKGAVAVESININGAGFYEFAVVPGTGYYFDVQQGQLIINGMNS